MVRKKKVTKQSISRRSFLKSGTLLAGTGVTGIVSGAEMFAGNETAEDCKNPDNNAELLYNGIQLPGNWPPTEMIVDSYDPMPVPYLVSPPRVIPIDVGRQLFVDDFLIEKTNATRKFHQPVKYAGNPLLYPEKEWEMNKGFCPMAAPFSDGVFYDPSDKQFKMWYMAGWYDNKTALATSKDGLHWSRPELDIVPGSNLVLVTPSLQRDGVSVWIDHDTKNADERFKLYMYVRQGEIGERLKEDGKAGGYLYTSPDGVHWQLRGKIGATGDNTTFFYNPFRKKWVFTVRTAWRAAQPWSTDPFEGKKRPRCRARSYWENTDFFAAKGAWKEYDPVFWLGADRLDEKRANYSIGHEPQLYKVDAVGYESLMIGLLQPHYGPPNEDCAKGGFPKLTELQLAFSRDGFYWDRSNRQTFIEATLKKDSWERAYVHSVGGVCNIVGDKLHFYYTAFKGDETKNRPPYFDYYSGMYANASTGLAILRRDGFASMEAGSAEKILLTRLLVFTGSFLFVNVDAPKGSLWAELCEENGTPIPGYRKTDCIPVSGDNSKAMVAWKNNRDLYTLAGKTIRIKFYFTRAKLYAFWISKTSAGKSGGATAAGGPEFTGTWDV